MRAMMIILQSLILTSRCRAVAGVFLLLVLLIACERIRDVEEGMPLILTGPVIPASGGGLEFTARVTDLRGGPYEGHGFVWGTLQQPELTGNNYVDLGALSRTGEIRHTVRFGLRPSTNYYVRTFVLRGKDVQYANSVSFHSGVGTPPVLIRIQPDTALWNDTVTLWCSGFSRVPEDNQVFFGSVRAEITEQTDSTFRVIVPPALDRSGVPVRLESAGTGSVDNLLFQLRPPRISGFEPTEALNGMSLRIYVDHVQPGNTRIFVGGVSLVPGAYGDGYIETTLSAFLLPGELDLEVEVAGQRRKAADKLRSRMPVITGFSPVQVRWGDTLRIYGRDFISLGDETRLSMQNSIPLPLLSQSDSLLTALFPEDYSMVKNRIEVTKLHSYGIARAASPAAYELLPPEVYSYAPVAAAYGDQIWIYGRHFPLVPNMLHIKVTDIISVGMDLVTRDSARFSLPQTEMPGDSTSFLLYVGPFEFPLKPVFRLLPP
jgi:hypothetical protein